MSACRRIWEEIATASEKEYANTFEAMKRKAPSTNNWEQQTKIIEEIHGYSLVARWEYLRAAVDTLLANCWEIALAKAKVCNKPIAKYTEAKKAYIEYPDGTRKYIE